MECTILSTKEDMAKYSNFIKQFPTTSFNASLKFLYFLTALLGKDHSPYYLIAKDNAGDIKGVLPAMLKKGAYGSVLNSLPWFGSNPGVITDDKNVGELLINSFLKIAKWTDCISATIIENPINTIQHDYVDIFHQYPIGRYLSDQRIGMITELPSCEGQGERDTLEFRLMSRFHSKTRNQVRKSIQECYTSSPVDEKAFDFLIETHQQNMKDIGAPYKSKEFEIIRQLEQGKDYKLFLSYAKKDDSPAAALLLKYFNNTVDYMIPAISPEYRELDPLHILIYEAMLDAAERGYKYWNWGGNLVAGMDGVKHFKRRFGAEKEFTYTYHAKQFKELPGWITKELILQNYPFFYVIPFRELGE